MNCCILGYGKMGKAIEEMLNKKGHNIVFVADSKEEILQHKNKLKNCDVAFEFSTPTTAYENIKICIDNNIAVVSGTTGWTDRLDEIKNYCKQKDASFLFAPNFSIGMTIFMEVSALLARLTNNAGGYKARINETHHIHKLDSPSGTAVKLKDIILTNSNTKDIPIDSIREGEVVGEHTINFSSDMDTITFSHNAKSRNAFVEGAIFAATKLIDKKGVFELIDLINL